MTDSTSIDTITQSATELIHGNMLVVHDTGLLLIGPAGIGKSETTLALLDRGHRFISDDNCLIHNNQNSKILTGRSPHHCAILHLREIGIIDVNKHYPGQYIQEHTIDLVITVSKNIHLMPESTGILPLTRYTEFGLSVPQINLTARPPTTMALLIEILAREYA